MDGVLCAVSPTPVSLSAFPLHTLAGGGTGGVFLSFFLSFLSFGSLIPLSWPGQALERATAWEHGRETRRQWRRRRRRETKRGGGVVCVGNEVFSFHPQKAECEQTGLDLCCSTALCL